MPSPRYSHHQSSPLSPLLTNLKRPSRQRLKHAPGIPLPRHLLHARKILPLSIQGKGFLPPAGVIEENEGVVEVLLLRGGFGARVEVFEEGVDVGVVGGGEVVTGEEEGCEGMLVGIEL